MSFKFDWSPFLINDENFDSISAVLTKALNRGPKPEAVVGHIKLKNLNVGSVPPRLHLVEVTDITDDSFKGKFRIEYDGNASISLQTFVEANPLKLFSNSLPSFAAPAFQSAALSLVLPLDFTISDLRLSGLVHLVMSKTRGVTMVFQNDTVESVNISSSLDFLPGAADMLKQEIEEELTLMFSDFIPEMLHKMSQQHLAAQDEDHFRSMMESHDDEEAKSLNKERSFTPRFFSDVLLNSSNSLRSVKDIRNCAQSLSLTSIPENQDVLNRACLLHQEQTPSSSLVSEDKTSDYYPGEKSYKPARKQRRIISFRKDQSAEEDIKVQSATPHSYSASGTPTSSPFLNPVGSCSSSPGGRRRPSSVNKRNLDSRSPSLSPALFPQKRLLNRSALTKSPLSPTNSSSAYMGNNGHDDLHIPALDFENLNHARKQSSYAGFSSSSESASSRQIKPRSKSNVATPDQIFSSSSLSFIHSMKSPPTFYPDHPADSTFQREKPTPGSAAARETPTVQIQEKPDTTQAPTHFFLTKNPDRQSKPSTPSNYLHHENQESSPPVISFSNDPSQSFYQLASAEIPFEPFAKSRHSENTKPPPVYQ